ncbi:hypothetical protein [Kitasatospora cineracea]|uniref:Uncharacterized protein n=1 Tax=Kitasatospora cineracea TaxID=88074 RepID=A0A8G1XG16_9ACTN|nr:hypothetical protein [Kitasatospora cineracea]ROR44692.1 hypothetical protein EDD39_2898 [Kitasatospora cineracea]
MNGELTGAEAGLIGALALASHCMRRKDADGNVVASFRDAAFFAARKPQAWDQWPMLTLAERRVVRQVGQLMPAEWCNPKAFKSAVLAFVGKLAPEGDGYDKSGGTVALVEGDPFAAEAALLKIGGDFLGHAERLTGRFFTPGKRPKATEFAGPGVWKTRTTYLGKEHGVTNREIEFPATPLFEKAPGHEALPRLTTAPACERIAAPVHELLEVAQWLSERNESVAYLHPVLKKFLSALKSSAGGELSELDLLSGLLQVLNAPTGSGKTVLVRVLASWAVLQGYRLAIALTDVRATLNMAWDINNDLGWLYELGKLDNLATCVPLMSATSMHKRAMDYAALTPSAKITQWDLRGQRDIAHLAYGCAQRVLMDPPDLYPPGEENCLTLIAPTADSAKRHACPYLPVCDKFRPVYEAAEANIVVTNHANLLDGALRVGAVIDGQEWRSQARGTAGVSALELALRSFDALVVDEVDAFQKTTIGRCTSSVVLASRKRDSALREIDQDAKRLPSENQEQILSPVSHARLMAEFLLLWLCSRALKLNPGNEAEGWGAAGRDNEGWRLTHSRDREILQLLFPDLVPSPDAVPPQLFHFLEEIMPERWNAPEPSDHIDDPASADWDALRRALAALTSPRSENFLSLVQQELHGLLSEAVPAANKRAAVVNLLATRTILRDLDVSMANLRRQATSLSHLDLASVRKILDGLHKSTVTVLYPLSALGRSISGYQIRGLEAKESEAELLSRCFEGDPHTFVSELGGLTALMVAGIQRPVLGLSATAYFPQAVQEHVHAPVKWWLPDTRPRSIVTRATPVIDPNSGDEREALRVGGIWAEKKPAVLRDLGRLLYEQHLDRRLRRLEERNAKRDENRARVILTANSYEQCAYLAHGLAQAVGLRHRICLLVKDFHQRDYEQHLPSHVRRMVREELEAFPDHGEILIAPLAVIARGLNIVVGTRSAVSEIFLCVRPVLSIEDTEWIHGSVNAAGINALLSGGHTDPLLAVEKARDASWRQLQRILHSPSRFSQMAHELQEELIAGMLVQLVQLAGRARRGETDMTLHIVDHSLHDTKFSSDLASIIWRIHGTWTREQKRMMNELYGQALQAFLAYAGVPDTDL